MKKGLVKNKFLIAFLGLVVGLSVIMVFALDDTDSAFASRPIKGYPVNEAGLSYGSLADADIFNEYPDLVFVGIDDDTYGYVYYSDYIEAEKSGVSNPEEATAYMNEHRKLSEELLQEELNSLLDAKQQISKREAREYLDDIGDEGTFDTAAKMLNSDSGVSKTKADNLISEAYDRATERISVYIPVYDIDGSTIIGEFPVGSLF